MTEAPDFVEAVVGYRAWHVDDEGMLRPWTFTTLPWQRGVNRAVCARDPRHRPPVADCMCGLYALTDPADRRLDFRADQAVGAVAAWGDLEVHRSGFRAEQACIVALALPQRAGIDQADRLERAAARYGVALVPAPDLSREALRHGASLPDDLWPPAWPSAPRGRRPGQAPAVDPAAFGGAARGIALDAHLWIETALGSVVMGLTRAVAAQVGQRPRLTLPLPGTMLQAGDEAATLTGDRGSFAMWTPVAGSVLAVNPRVQEDPGLAVRDPEGAGWMLRLAPRDWARDSGGVAWGSAAPRHYAAGLQRDAERGDAFADLRVGAGQVLPPVRSAADVLAHLRADRASGRFADAGAVDRELGGRLRVALAADRGLRARLGRLGWLVRFSLSDPDAELVLDLRAGTSAVGPAAAGDPDLVLSCSADDAYRWFTGVLDTAAALRSGALASSRPAGPTLRALAMLKHLRVAGWSSCPVWAR